MAEPNKQQDAAPVPSFTGKQVKIVIAGLVSALVSVGYFGDRIWRHDPFTGSQGNAIGRDLAQLDDHVQKIHTIQQTMLHRMEARETADSDMLQMIIDHIRQQH